jgi:hypothetical protein
VTRLSPHGESARAPGPNARSIGALLSADHDGAFVRAEAGGSVSEETTTSGDPGSGIIDFDLTDGSQLRRRDVTAFELASGIAHVRTGPISGRLIILHGVCYLSAAGGDNPEGIDVHLITKGDQMKVEVVKGKVLLNATDAGQKNTVYITLEAGETSVARPGAEPEKGVTDWFDTE